MDNFISTDALRYATAIKALYDGDMLPNVVSAETDTQVLVENLYQDRWLVVFPGTASLKDWETDLRAAKVPWKPRSVLLTDGEQAGKVHSGFAHAYQSVHSKIADKIPVGADVTVVGHSLGGALATLCAHALYMQNRAIRNVFTFGSPRVGNRTFARAYDDYLYWRTWRVVNAHDPVPWLPPLLVTTLFDFTGGIYTHAGRKAWLGDPGVVEIERPLWKEGEQFTSAWLNKKDALQNSLSIASAHNINAYIGKLKGLA